MSAAEHAALVRDILAELGSLRGVIMGANPCGIAHYINDDTGDEYHVPYGWPAPGGPDIIVLALGRLIGLEVKTGKARLTREQRACHMALRAAGGHAFVVRSLEDARKAIRFSTEGVPLSRSEFARMVDVAQ